MKFWIIANGYSKEIDHIVYDDGTVYKINNEIPLFKVPDVEQYLKDMKIHNTLNIGPFYKKIETINNTEENSVYALLKNKEISDKLIYMLFNFNGTINTIKIKDNLKVSRHIAQLILYKLVEFGILRQTNIKTYYEFTDKAFEDTKLYLTKQSILSPLRLLTDTQEEIKETEEINKNIKNMEKI